MESIPYHVKLAKKLAGCIRLFTSDKDVEIDAAARAIERTLKAAAKDVLHALADRVEQPNGDLNEAEIKKVYAAGYSAGQRDAEVRHFGSVDFRHIDGTPNWEAMALFCQEQGDRLKNDKERQFVNEMAERTTWREPTEKQGKWLLSIFRRLGGRI